MTDKRAILQKNWNNLRYENRTKRTRKGSKMRQKNEQYYRTNETTYAWKYDKTDEKREENMTEKRAILQNNWNNLRHEIEQNRRENRAKHERKTETIYDVKIGQNGREKGANHDRKTSNKYRKSETTYDMKIEQNRRENRAKHERKTSNITENWNNLRHENRTKRTTKNTTF